VENNGKIILDLCGGTGAWSEPYKKAGYDVHVITLPKWDVTNFAASGGVGELKFFAKGEFDGLASLKLLDMYRIHGILAAPPCTEFSLAKNNQERNLYKAMLIVGSCMKIIWAVRSCSGSNLKFWALENPRGLLRQFLGAPAFTFEHWQFGGAGIKPTDLWGYFNLPKTTVKNRPNDLTVKYPNGRINSRRWSQPECPPEYEGLTRSELRAITPAGFANAFYMSNK